MIICVALVMDDPSLGRLHRDRWTFQNLQQPTLMRQQKTGYASPAIVLMDTSMMASNSVSRRCDVICCRLQHAA